MGEMGQYDVRKVVPSWKKVPDNNSQEVRYIVSLVHLIQYNMRGLL